MLDLATRTCQRNVLDYLAANHLNWDANFEETAALARDMLARITSERGWLAALFSYAENETSLRQRAETHQLLDYVVLYDALDRGIRLRLHLSTQDHLQRPHDHRFDFSTRILCGSYEHCLISPRVDPYSLSSEEHAIAYQDKNNPDPLVNLKNADFKELIVRHVSAGSMLSLSNRAIHTVNTAANTVSLVLRGPARKTRSMIYDRAEETLWWRFGAEKEPPSRRQAKIMSNEKLQDAKRQFTKLGIFDV
jgi:hypothetical protein